MSTMDDTAALLDAVAGLGDYFALPAAEDGPWLPITTLLTDAATLSEYASRTRRATASAFGLDEALVPVKAAASSVHLSIAARVLSPVVGAAVTLSKIPVLDAETLRWQQDSSHRPRLAVTRPRVLPVSDAADAAAAITGSVINEVIVPLNDTLRSGAALSPQVLWGNVISAANGAVTVMSQTRPECEQPGRALIAALMATDQLAGAAAHIDGTFRRRNCCLFYLVPGAGYCGDCVLVD
ncbi:hypothetical protein MMAG44476_02525 [Mycolicibacterium mageritense DSM 44476 = CIP 104973]|uniref:Ferric siderophore reductase C-terminal domain-containing protein n=3 Tax=Mycolicibacterium TaxID=1866885 RepID=A0ABM7HX07_MYCME|nr:hypothetical protein MMAGJ_44200 [Mycolicibacterium mageritense]